MTDINSIIIDIGFFSLRLLLVSDKNLMQIAVITVINTIEIVNSPPVIATIIVVV